MKLLLIVLFLGVVFAGPQAGNEKQKKISGDYEEVPYTVIQEFEVSFFLFSFFIFQILGIRGKKVPQR